MLFKFFDQVRKARLQLLIRFEQLLVKRAPLFLAAELLVLYLARDLVLPNAVVSLVVDVLCVRYVVQNHRLSRHLPGGAASFKFKSRCHWAAPQAETYLNILLSSAVF